MTISEEMIVRIASLCVFADKMVFNIRVKNQNVKFRSADKYDKLVFLQPEFKFETKIQKMNFGVALKVD